MKSFAILYFFTGLCVLHSCTHKQDDDHDDKDHDAPVIEIYTPKENDTIPAAANLHITGKVTDKSLHELEIEVELVDGGTKLLDISPEVHDLSVYNIDQTVNTENTTGLVKAVMTLTAEDHRSNITKLTTYFYIKG